jgi:hypothetical protein
MVSLPEEEDTTNYKANPHWLAFDTNSSWVEQFQLTELPAQLCTDLYRLEAATMLSCTYCQLQLVASHAANFLDQRILRQRHQVASSSRSSHPRGHI